MAALVVVAVGQEVVLLAQEANTEEVAVEAQVGPAEQEVMALSILTI